MEAPSFSVSPGSMGLNRFLFHVFTVLSCGMSFLSTFDVQCLPLHSRSTWKLTFLNRHLNTLDYSNFVTYFVKYRFFPAYCRFIFFILYICYTIIKYTYIYHDIGCNGGWYAWTGTRSTHTRITTQGVTGADVPEPAPAHNKRKHKNIHNTRMLNVIHIFLIVFYQCVLLYTFSIILFLL